MFWFKKQKTKKHLNYFSILLEYNASDQKIILITDFHTKQKTIKNQKVCIFHVIMCRNYSGLKILLGKTSL